MLRALGLAFAAVAMTAFAPRGEPNLPTDTIAIGSKNFTESRILAEICAQLLEDRTDLTVERRLGLGGTLVCYAALRSGDIDAYPEYTGTAWSIVLHEPGKVTDPLRCYLDVARRYRKELGLVWLEPFGLNNTYALAVPRSLAEKLGLRTISDLAAKGKDLRAGFSLEFMNRDDGWPGVREAYGLEFASVRSMEHGLAYEGIAAGQLDVIDAYATDGKLLKYDLTILRDDRSFFPPYNAAPLFRESVVEAHPEIRDVLADLAFRIDDATIQHLNYSVEEGGETFAAAARGWLVDEGLVTGDGKSAGTRSTTPRSERGFLQVMRARGTKTLSLGWQHVQLTFIAVALAVLLGVPLGIAASRFPLLRRVSLAGAGIVQTIPSLAMLAFLIPIPGFGLGVTSAIAALFVYALLPILRNTYTGIVEVDPDLIEAARGLGLTDRQTLWRVQLPLASRTILAGVRTAAVISVGVATLAAFIGAGGLGEPIVTGLQLNDVNLILSGAVPAAVLALLVDGALGLVERYLTPAAAS